MDVEHIKIEFNSIARKIWGDRAIDAMNISYETTNMIAYAGVKTVRNRMLGLNLSHTLLLNPKIFSLPDDKVKAILIHEAVHLGIHKHGKRFRDVCIRHGGCISAMHMNNERPILEIKEGSRYVPLKQDGKIITFDSFDDAKNYGKAYVILHPKVKLRAKY